MQVVFSPAVISFRSPRPVSPIYGSGKAILRREDQHFGDFLERVPPVEPNMGEFYGSGGRIGQSSVFRNGGGQRENVVRSNRTPIFAIRACSEPFSLLSAWKMLVKEKSKSQMADVGPRTSLAPVQISIRPARSTDVDIVLGILDEAATWLQEHKIPSVWKPGEFSRQSFLDQISRGEVYIALVDDLTVGTFILQWTDSLFWGERPADAGYIHKLAIRPGSGGKGIGLEM